MIIMYRAVTTNDLITFSELQTVHVMVRPENSHVLIYRHSFLRGCV